MTTHTAETSPLIVARVAGFVYLLVVPLGIFSLYGPPSRLIVPGDAATTAKNIIASESLFRLGIVSDLLASMLMLSVVLVLYRLLRPVSKTMALVMVIFLLPGVSLAMFNAVSQFASLQLLSDADYLTVFNTEQLQALAYLLLHSEVATIAFIFWGLWLFPLGYLVFKSGFLPRILGLVLMISCFGYPVSSFAKFLGYTVNVGMFAARGEVLFILWLLFKGVNVEQWEKRALESARA